MDKTFLIKIANTKMPFGKYKDYYLVDIPEYYIVWFKQQGFPPGELGLMLENIYEIKLNGLEPIIRKLRQN